MRQCIFVAARLRRNKHAANSILSIEPSKFFHLDRHYHHTFHHKSDSTSVTAFIHMRISAASTPSSTPLPSRPVCIIMRLCEWVGGWIGGAPHPTSSPLTQSHQVLKNRKTSEDSFSTVSRPMFAIRFTQIYSSPRTQR